MLTQGPWDSNAQYGGTPAALLTWAVERVPTLVPMRIARFTIDMHRPVPLGRLSIETQVVREGKRLQIVVAIIRDPAVSRSLRATALRFRLGAGPQTQPPTRAWRRSRPRLRAGPGAAASTARPQRLRRRPESRDAGGSSAATSWYRATCPVIAGEQPSPMVRLAWASDFTANSGNYLDLSRWSAINADLTINLGRAPVGEWTGVATRAWYPHDGIGHARADLFDTDGLVGTCTASLLVDAVAAPYSDHPQTPG